MRRWIASTADRVWAGAMRFDRIGMRCAESARPRARCLIASAAAEWNVPPGECETTAHVVRHPASGREARFGSLAARAATLSVPRDVPLKDPSRYRLIGSRVNGIDNHKVVTGQPLFGIDVRLPNMKFAAVAKCPVFNGRPLKIDATQGPAGPGRPRYRRDQGPRQSHVPDARRRRGRRLYMGGVQGSRRARRAVGRGTLRDREQRDASPSSSRSSLPRRRRSLHNSGRVEDALAAATVVVDNTYSFPFVSHATLEPHNCTRRLPA